MTSYLTVRHLPLEENARIQSTAGGALSDVVVLPNSDGMYRGETRAVVKLLKSAEIAVSWPTDEPQFSDTFDADWISPIIYILQYSTAPIVLGIIANYLSAKLFNVEKVHIRLVVQDRFGMKDFQFDGPPHAIPGFTEALKAASEGGDAGDAGDAGDGVAGLADGSKATVEGSGAGNDTE